jgi:hypothetical protein
VRQRLLKGLNAGTPFRTVVRDLRLTSQQVWGLTKTDQDWSAELEAALTAARRETWTTVLTPRTCTAASAGIVGNISASGWLGAALETHDEFG